MKKADLKKKQLEAWKRRIESTIKGGQRKRDEGWGGKQKCDKRITNGNRTNLWLFGGEGGSNEEKLLLQTEEKDLEMELRVFF
mmetsp:Transcript_12205/g.23629  ORF Transcript_12205/g.23629 Transcript_12205/m.23629 type:complete len:83 (+) Transcript_12205:349-597(+)